MEPVKISLKARSYQQELINWFRNGGRRAVCVWHRRAGKDRVATFIESELAFKRVGLYWHCLPQYSQARKVIWDNITRDGQRLIDTAFPPQVIKRRMEHEMKIELINGSVWQIVGADNFDSLVGSNPVHVTYSEYALMSPKAREYLRPIIAENDGSELFISTPRGYNHFHDLYEFAKTSKHWFCSRLSVHDTKVIPDEVLEEERKTMPEELFRQEFECDFSAANVGAILGRWVEAAEKDGRVNADVEYDPDGAPLELSSDIGFRDTAVFWFWQPRADGFALVDYDEDSGCDAEEWIERLKAKCRDNGYKVGKVWLPHDARAKTFSTRDSAMEQFLRGFGADVVRVVPQTKKLDKINAARAVMPKCWFNSEKCEKGLKGLRAWAFEWNNDTRQFSRDPKHDWASHPGDGFAEGALMMKERVREVREAQQNRDVQASEGTGLFQLPALDELWKSARRPEARY